MFYIFVCVLVWHKSLKSIGLLFAREHVTVYLQNSNIFSLFILASWELLFTLCNCNIWSQTSEKQNNPKPLSELLASCFKFHQNLLVSLLCWTRHPSCLLKQLPGCCAVSVICLLTMMSACLLSCAMENSRALALLEWADSFQAVVGAGFSMQRNKKSWWTQ